MAKTSAGVVLFRRSGDGVEVLLVHPGGPFWKGKHEGVWSIPKGEIDVREDPLAAARREFAEEIGHTTPGDGFMALGEVTQKGGKVVVAWAVEGDIDPETIASNTFTMEWPPRSGRTAEFPEVDRAAWFPVDEARTVINAAQAAFLDRLEQILG